MPNHAGLRAAAEFRWRWTQYGPATLWYLACGLCYSSLWAFSPRLLWAASCEGVIELHTCITPFFFLEKVHGVAWLSHRHGHGARDQAGHGACLLNGPRGGPSSPAAAAHVWLCLLILSVHPTRILKYISRGPRKTTGGSFFQSRAELSNRLAR
jgi:hypothetical protein